MVSLHAISTPSYKRPILLPHSKPKTTFLFPEAQDSFIKQAKATSNLHFSGNQSDDEYLDNLADSFAQNVSIRKVNDDAIPKSKLDYYAWELNWPEMSERDGSSVDNLVSYFKKNKIDVNALSTFMAGGKIVMTTPLTSAAASGDVLMIKALLKAGADIELAEPVRGSSPLIRASQEERLASVQTLIDERANVDSSDARKLTSLRYASERGFISIVKALLRGGANPNLPSVVGATPLTEAARNGHTTICKDLIANGANVDQADNQGCTPLFIATQEGKQGPVEALLEHGAAVDKPANDNSTPLLVARIKEYRNIAQILVNAGADENASNDHGITPFMVPRLTVLKRLT